MKLIHIEKYEWPLPSDDNQARAIVAELFSPKLLMAWRQFTYSLIIDVFSPKLKGTHQGNFVPLSRYEALYKYHKGAGPPGRLQLASHNSKAGGRRPIHITEVTVDTIITVNGFSYFVYDSDYPTRRTFYSTSATLSSTALINCRKIPSYNGRLQVQNILQMTLRAVSLRLLGTGHFMSTILSALSEQAIGCNGVISLVSCILNRLTSLRRMSMR